MDGRRGRQLDRNSRASGPLRSCLRHLWMMHHQVAEGLPDSFAFDKAGAGWATLDIHPLRSRTARSPVEDVAEVDSDSDIEDSQYRMIAGVASSVAAVSAPDAKAVIGPGANLGPLRLCHLLRSSTFGGNTGRCRCSKG